MGRATSKRSAVGPNAALVPVARRVEHDDEGARRRSCARPARPAPVVVRAERLDRRDPAQALLHRSGEQRLVGGERGPLVGLLGEHLDATGEEAARGLVAGHEQRDAEHDQLVVGQRRTADLGIDERRHQVVARRRLPAAHEVAEVGERARRSAAMFSAVGWSRDLDHGVGPPAEVVAVAVGDAEQVGDDRDRDGQARCRPPRRSRHPGASGRATSSVAIRTASSMPPTARGVNRRLSSLR